MCELCSKIHLNNFAFLLEAGHGAYEKMHLIFDTKFPRKREMTFFNRVSRTVRTN